MNIEARQLAKKRQLLAIKDILDDMGIPFWLHSGVLLGYYRERDLIKHDPDLDLGLLRADLPNDFCYKLAKRLEGKGMRIGWRTRTCLKLYPEPDSPYVGSHCDLFIHELLDDEIEIELMTDKTKVTYKYPFNGFVKARFLGKEFNIPANAKESIFAQYGPGWQTPVKTFVWDKDPANIVGKQKLVLDEHPTTNVVTKKLADSMVEPIACLGPLTEDDINMLGDVCVYSTQSFNGKKIKNQEFDYIRCDEAHYDRDMNEAFGTVFVPHPELYTEHNMRTLLARAQTILQDGGLLAIAGTPPNFVEDYMFEEIEAGIWKKYNEHENWEKNVTAVVVTYESPDMAEDCVNSLRKMHPDMRVIVADNSKHPKHVNGARLLPLPEDSGLSYSRNAGVGEVQTPYTLILDDDQMIEDSTSIKKMYDALRTNKLDIVGGDVINCNTKQGHMWSGAILLRYSRGVELQKGVHKTFPDGTQKVDVVANFLLAKTSSLLNTRWRDELKLHEHLDFFMLAQDNHLEIGLVKSAVCIHKKGPNARTPEYRAKRGRMFRALMMRLNGLNYINRFGSVYTYETAEAYKPRKRTSPTPKSKVRMPGKRQLNLVVQFPELFRKKAPGAGKGRNPAPGA